MQRRQFLKQASSIAGVLMVMGPSVMAHPINKNINLSPLKKDHDEWSNLVTEREFDILFEEGTEPPGSSA